jgi:hypothetical protein
MRIILLAVGLRLECFIKPDGHLDDSAHNYKTYLVKGDGAGLE